MFHKDPLLQLNSPSHSPHNLIPPLISDNSTILDVGCNTGYLAKQLKSKGVITDGLDINEEALKIAKKNCRTVFKRDLYLPRLDLPHNKYNHIILADILEHLPRPDLILKDLKQYLKTDGTIIASIPNIARIELRIKLLMGNFDYTDSGIISTDHLRFFTKKNAIKMFEECGYTVEKTLPTGLGNIIKVLPTLTAFQFIYVASLKK